MKKIILAALFFMPTLVFAGGSHHKSPPPVVPSTVTPIPSVTPSVTPTVPSGGNGQIYCSGPTAPGWRVGLPYGGCNVPPSTTTVILPPKIVKPTPVIPVVTPVPSVPLNAIPPTGLGFWENVADIFSGIFSWITGQ